MRSKQTTRVSSPQRLFVTAALLFSYAPISSLMVQSFSVVVPTDFRRRAVAVLHRPEHSVWKQGCYDGHLPTSRSMRVLPLFMGSEMASTDAAVDRESSTSAVDNDESSTLRHKVVVLEDVVSRLQRQKSQLVNDLRKEQSLTEEIKANITARAAQDRHALVAEKKKSESAIKELEQKLQTAEEMSNSIHQENRDKFSKAKDTAIAEHQRLEAKVQKLEALLASAQDKLDSYRKQSYERESKLRQSLRDQQEAQRMLQVVNEEAAKEVEKAKAALAKEQEKVEETLMISEASVAAADRREANLKRKLEETRKEVASLQKKLQDATTVNMPGRSNDKEKQEVEQLKEQIQSVHAKFETERRRERQKWAREIDALQEALEIARSTPPVVQHERAAKPGIFRRIRRKILHN